MIFAFMPSAAFRQSVSSPLIKQTFDEVIKSKTFKCSIYFIKYVIDKDEEYFYRFISMFSKFTPEEKIQVLRNVKANLSEQNKLKKQSDEKNNIRK